MSKNYEQDELDEIPNFKSIRDDDNLNYSNVENSSGNKIEEDYDDKKVIYRNVKQSTIIIAIVLIIVLFVLSIIGIVLNVNKNKAYNELQNEFDNYKTQAIETENSLNAKIVELETTITTQEVTEEVVEETEIYVVNADNGLNVRNAPKVDGDNYADYDSLSASVKAKCQQDGDIVVVYNAEFEISVIQKNGDQTWGQIDTNAWICLDYCEKK